MGKASSLAPQKFMMKALLTTNTRRTNDMNSFYWEENKSKRHKHIWRDTSMFGLQPSRECAPFVPWKCPVSSAGILSNLCGLERRTGRDLPDVSHSPPSRPQDTSEAYRLQNSFVCVCVLFISFSSPYSSRNDWTPIPTGLLTILAKMSVFLRQKSAILGRFLHCIF